MFLQLYFIAYWKSSYRQHYVFIFKKTPLLNVEEIFDLKGFLLKSTQITRTK